MPHKCTQCGREFTDGSTVILKGCPSCGGKKFLYVKAADIHKDVLEEKTIGQIAEETKQQFLELKEEKSEKRSAEEPKRPRKIEIYDRIESITVVNPGTYELNIEKLAESDEVVVRMGSDDRYLVDIHSMGKPAKKKKDKAKK